MSKKRILSAIVGLVALSASATGCEDLRSQIVTSAPWTGPIIGGRPQPSPFKLATGNIRGIVHGKDGISQPIGMAFVTTGSVSCTAANPQPDQTIPSADDKDDGKEKIFVMHDFGDGAGEVATERRLRQKAGGPNWQDKYVYLKQGEFFLEGVPEGYATLRASYGGVNSQGTQVEVYANNVRADIKIPLYIPGPVQVDGSNTPPKVVDFVGSKPDTGISVTVQTKKNDDGSTEVTVNYKPDPPDVTVNLKAPPGSAGTVIKGINLVYSWDTISGRHGETTPVNIPISPVVVAPAQDTAYGPPATITVPVGSAIIQEVFKQKNPATNNTDPPGLIIATMEFVDEQGFVVLDKNFQNLQVSTILRALALQ
jgi:hypothetical protein